MAENTTVTTARYGTIITAIGSVKIAAGIIVGKKINITHAAVGDGSGAYYKPTVDQTGLLRECWRGEIASARISETNPNMIDVKFIVPAEVGGFTIREAALIDDEGDTIAICNTPDAEKVNITDGVSFPLQMVMHIIVTDASVVSFSVNPSLDTVSREEMEAAIAKSQEIVLQKGLKFIISPTEPEECNVLWLDTGEQPDPTQYMMLEIGPLEDSDTVSANIDGDVFGVKNVGVNITPTADRMSLEVTN